jgi:uncharacterized protein YndB with AHSA1/START domain
MQAISTTAGYASFWTSDCKVEPEVGSIGVFGFGGSKLEMRLDAVQPGRRIAWTCVNDWPGTPRSWKGTAVSYELTQNDNGFVGVLFQHGNWPAELPQTAIAATAYIWATVLRALKAYAETGKAQPVFSSGGFVAAAEKSGFVA